MAPDIASPKSDGLGADGLRWSGRISLTPRILAVNVFALALLAGGFFYLDSYRTRIVDARLEQSARELQLLAIGLESVPPERQRQLIAAYARQTGDRVRRYAPDGHRLSDSFAMDAPRYRVFGYWFVFRLNKKLWPVQGRNVLEVELCKRDRQIIPEVRLRDVELEIKYLMGKNYHRDLIDNDLGPGKA